MMGFKFSFLLCTQRSGAVNQSSLLAQAAAYAVLLHSQHIQGIKQANTE